MTEEEAKKAIFQIHREYMSHPAQERLKLYDEYQEKRRAIQHELARSRLTEKEEENKIIR